MYKEEKVKCKVPKFVILGSCKHEPYAVLAMPNRLDAKLYENDHEAAYAHAWEYFKPAIESADVVIVYAPDGIGEHTQRDLDYAIKLGKKILYI